MKTAELPVGSFVHKTWEQDGEHLHDWRPLPVESRIVAFEVVRYPDYDSLVWRREDGYLIEVGESDLLAGMRSTGVRAKLLDQFTWANGAEFRRLANGAAETFHAMILAHYWNGNPFKARVWRI